MFSSEISKKQFNFLVSTLIHFNSGNRGVDKNYMCSYVDGCAIGRHCDVDTRKALDDVGDMSNEPAFALLPDELKELGQSFLYDIQSLHDSHHRWNNNGYCGEMEYLIETFGYNDEWVNAIADFMYMYDEIRFTTTKAIIKQNEDGFYVQSLNLDYAACGSSLESAKSNFIIGLSGTVVAHIEKYGSYRKLLLKACPLEAKDLFYILTAPVNQVMYYKTTKVFFYYDYPVSC